MYLIWNKSAFIGAFSAGTLAKTTQYDTTQWMKTVQFRGLRQCQSHQQGSVALVLGSSLPLSMDFPLTEYVSYMEKSLWLAVQLSEWVQEKRKKRKRVHWVCPCSVHIFNNQMTLYREYVWYKGSLFARVMWNRRCITSSVPLAVFLCSPSPSFASFVFVWTWLPTPADPSTQLTSIHYLTTSSISTRLSSPLSARLSETLSGNSASALILLRLNFCFSRSTVTIVTTIIHCWADVLKNTLALNWFNLNNEQHMDSLLSLWWIFL